MRDTQQKRVYRWESEWSGWNISSLSLRQVRNFVRTACHKYGIKAPPVYQHDGLAMSYSLVGSGTERAHISIQAKEHLNAAIALHESAHFICDHIFGDSIEDHSAEWLGIYLYLMEEAGVAPRVALHATARHHRLRWVPSGTISPQALKGQAAEAGRRRKIGYEAVLL